MTKNDKCEYKYIPIKRPQYIPKEAGFSAKIQPNNRRFIHSINRPNFEKAEIQPRKIVDFDKIQALDIAQFGSKVQLGEKTIEQLFKVQIGDPTDITWTTEYNRRIALGETPQQLIDNPPLGRKQRTKTEQVNFGQQGLNTNQQINMLKTAITQGNSENTHDLSEIAASVAGLLSNQDQIADLTLKNYKDLVSIITRVNISSDWKKSFKHRLYNLNQYKEDIGLINLYLLSDIHRDSINKPVYNISKSGRKSTLGLEGIPQAMSAKSGNKILDLETRSIITLASARELVASGIDKDVFEDPELPIIQSLDDVKEE